MTDLATALGQVASTKAISGGSIVRIEDFGGAADWNGTTGTDNLTPLLDAIASITYGSGTNIFGPTILLGLGRYYFSGTIHLHKVIRLVGAGAVGVQDATGGGTALVFPANTTAFVFHNGEDAQPWAKGSVIQGFSITGSGTDTTKHGIVMWTRAEVKEVTLFNIPGDGIRIQADSVANGTNANNWRLEKVHVNSCGGDALYVVGSDANAGVCIDFETQGQGIPGCGVRDESGLGNHYLGLNLAGYGDTGVYNSGRNYVLIANDGTGSTTTPGSNAFVWQDVGAAGAASTSYPQWVSGTSYKLTRPIATFGNSNRSNFAGLYVEGSGLCHINPPAVAIGGQAGFTHFSAHLHSDVTTTTALTCNLGAGGQATFQSGQAGYTNLGSYAYAVAGSAPQEGIGTGLNILEHRRGVDGNSSYQFGYYGTDIRYAYLNAKNVWEITTPSTTQTFGTGSAISHMPIFSDLALKDWTAGDPSVNVRLMGMRSSAPTTGAHAQGEFYFNIAPSAAGYIGWVCVTAGTPGTWKRFGAIEA